MGLLLKGIAASQGIAIGRAVILQPSTVEVAVSHDVDVEAEVARFERAVETSLRDVQVIYETARQRLGEEQARIFESHMLMLQDPTLTDGVTNHIRRHHVNAETALLSVVNELCATFEEMQNEYMAQRAADVKDVGTRVLANLANDSRHNSRAGVTDPEEPVIAVAHDLLPSDTIQLDTRRVQAFVTDIGGRTSHSAIMAQSLGIPAVVGLRDVTAVVQDGVPMIVDGSQGIVIVSPSSEQLAEYEQRRSAFVEQAARLSSLVNEPTVTKDGRKVELVANIGTPNDLPHVLASGAEGIGLFRTEFLYMNRDTAPTEDEQFAAYRAVLEGMQGKPVIIRTLDVGGDKEIPYLQLPAESNPFLGYRAIRMCVEREELFKTQLRAILRASYYGNAKIMYPMIATIDELRKANALLRSVQEELRRAGVPFSDNLQVGIMVETPASALSADILAKEVDFFSIGTNDLTQYTMACDRLNEKVSYLYQPYHPAVLRLVKMVIDAAHERGKWVGMCGELASDPVAIPVLIGLGLDEFSMSAASVLRARSIIRSLSHSQMEMLAREALQMETQEQVCSLVLSRVSVDT